MSLLQERIEILGKDLLANPPRISAYHDLPFAILHYDPASEFEARKQMSLFATRLQLMLGEAAATEVAAEGTGRIGNPEEELRRYLERAFFKEHIQKYRKRPVYWLLQSPRKEYGVWLFHEKLTKDTLYRIRGEQYLASKIRLLETHIADLRRQRDAAQGRERRALEKQMAELEDVLDDLRAFAERIDAILQRGYTLHIDDGVLINMAPLWELIPSWQAEPKKCWEALARGDYDWSHQAMDHRPEQVRDKCKTNRSYAIAHGLA